MSFEWFIVKRDLRSAGKVGFVSFITGFAILGVTIGTAAVILALSVLGGFERELRDKVFGFITHVQVTGFQGQPLLDYPSSIKKVRERIPEVRDIAPFAAKEAMVRAGENIDGIYLKGILPELDPTTVRRYVTQGRFLAGGATTGESEILIGKKLANKLEVDLDSKVVVFGLPHQTASLTPRAMVFRIVGIFESGMGEYDDLYAFTTLEDAQKLFQLGEGVSGYDVAINIVDKAPEVAASIQKLLGYPHYARTAETLYRNLFAWIALQQKPAPIFLGLIIIVATVNIIGTLFMFVLEKTRNIGVLKSLGATQSSIQRIFLYHGAFIALVGVVFGNALAYGLAWVQLTYKPLAIPSEIYFMSSAPILLQTQNFVFVSAVVFALCVAASFIPARSASRLDPLVTLRFG